MDSFCKKTLSFILNNRKKIAKIYIVILVLSFFGFYNFITKLRPELEYLLPQNGQFVIDTKKFNEIFPYSENTLIYLKSENPLDHELSALAQEIDKNVPFIKIVKYDFSEEISYFKKNEIYFRSPKEIEGILEKIDPLTRNINKIKFNDVEKIYGEYGSYLNLKKNLGFLGFLNLPDGKLISKDHKEGVIVLIHDRNLTNLKEAKEFSEKLISILKSYKDKSSIDYKINGNATNLISEYRSLWGDIIESSIYMTLFLSFILFLFFRSVRFIVLLGLPLLSGLGLLYFIAGMLFSTINSNSFFLSTLIAGSSVNVGVIILANSFSAFRKTKNREELVFEAVLNSYKPTFFAMITTAIVYGSLFIFNFKGYADFGLLGFMGMFLCWISYYVFMPIFLMSNFLRDKDFEEFKITSLFKVSALKINKKILLTLLSGLVVFTMGFLTYKEFFRPENFFEKDMNKIRNANYEESSFNHFKSNMQNISFSSQLIPTGMMALGHVNDLDKATFYLRYNKEIQEFLPSLKVYNFHDILPASRYETQELILKLQKFNLGELKKNPKITKMEEGILDLVQTHDKELTINDVPAFFKLMFMKDDLSKHREMIYFSYDLNALEKNAFNLIKFTDEVENAKKVLSSPKDALYTGIIPTLAKIEKEIVAKAWYAILISFVGIVLIVLITLRDVKQSSKFVLLFLFLISSYFLILYLFDLKIHVLNFVAILLTMGIGIDYSMNIIEGDETVSSFVILSSLTTLISYLALFLGTDQLALKSFAELSFIGELMAIVFSLLLTKPLFKEN